MEKSVFIILLSFLGFSLNAQDSLCVFNLKGNAYSKISSSLKPLTKGSFINSKSTILVNESCEITTINENGDAYQIAKAGEYKFNEILNQHAIEDSKGLTSKYFKLIWDELLKKRSGKTIIGGVFRGDILMESPKDSIKSASSKFTFKWKTEEETSQYYLFIKNIKTEELIKFATNGSELSLYKAHSIFSEGEDFQWSVSTSEFPNLKNTPSYSFTLIDRAEFENLKSNYKDLIAALKVLGLTYPEIENSLCETYGICK